MSHSWGLLVHVVEEDPSSDPPLYFPLPQLRALPSLSLPLNVKVAQSLVGSTAPLPVFSSSGQKPY